MFISIFLKMYEREGGTALPSLMDEPPPDSFVHKRWHSLAET